MSDKTTPAAGLPTIHVVRPPPAPRQTTSTRELLAAHTDQDRKDFAELREYVRSVTARQTGVLGAFITIATGIAAIVHALISG